MPVRPQRLAVAVPATTKPTPIRSARPNIAVDIVPRANTFVIFRADRIVHEVRPSHRERLAASVWFYGGSKAQAQAAVARGEIQA